MQVDLTLHMQLLGELFASSPLPLFFTFLYLEASERIKFSLKNVRLKSKENLCAVHMIGQPSSSGVWRQTSISVLKTMRKT